MARYKSVRTARSENMLISERFSKMSLSLFLLPILIMAFSLVMLFSAGAGSFSQYVAPQLIKIALSIIVMFIVSLSNIKIWVRFAYWGYALALITTILVSFIGFTGMGAQRWINLGFMNIQPSEFMKIALVMVLARYFAWYNSGQISQFKNYIIPIILFAVPFIFIVIQPDLGTGLSLGAIMLGMFFIVGANRNWFILGIILTILSTPIIWFTAMQDYQKDRIITFINPDHDQMGRGYQITQAKIAFGSGGFIGKGYMRGTQGQNQFLPEKQTDFIWTMVGEEFGFIGSFALLMLYVGMVLILYRMARQVRSRYAQLVIFGVGINWFIYYFINIGMSMGLVPAVGVPLPLFSFGGSSLLALMFGFGLVQNSWVHRDLQLSAKGG